MIKEFLGIAVFAAYISGTAVANPKKALEVPMFVSERMVAQEKGYAVFPAGYQLPIERGRRTLLKVAETGTVFGHGRVDFISNVLLPRAEEYMKAYPGSLAGYFKIFYDIDPAPKSVKLVRISKVVPSDEFEVLARGELRPQLPKVTTVDKKAMLKMVSKGALLVDVRAPFFLDKIPFIKGTTRLSLIRNLELNKKSGYSFKLHQLDRMLVSDRFVRRDTAEKVVKASLNKNVIIVCLHPSDFNCTRSLLKLRFMGAKNLHWYYDGLYDWFGYQYKTPIVVSGIETIGFSKFKKLYQSKVPIIDVRGKKVFELSGVKDTINVPFRYPILKPFKKGSYPKNVKETRKMVRTKPFPIKRVKKILSDPLQPVVVMGEGDASWNAYVAALALRDEGFSKVYFFRGGFSEWLSRQGRLEEQ